MSLSLIGIIFVQAYFINNTLENEEKNFTLNVKRSLSFVSKTIENKELISYNKIYQNIVESGANPDSTKIRASLILNSLNEDTNEITIYQNAISEESFKVPSMFFDIGLDSVSVSRFTNQRETVVYDRNTLDGNTQVSPIKTIQSYTTLDDIGRKIFETSYRDFYRDYPVYKRISTEEVHDFLDYQLKSDGIEIDFEFAIYDEDLSTKVQSKNFELIKPVTYGVPVFLDNNNESDYRLYVNFPDRNKFLLSSILRMLILSIIFTTVIVVAYSSAIYQLIKQRKISQIKTDFINNMTHEFKTPIATINLALDSIKNPKIINDQEKVMRYLNMIKDENKRMHAQVENVLRISKLEKNELNISKDRVKLHDLIEDAITHVELIVEDRQGYVNTHLNADKSSVLANETHFTNVIVNILDNAIKYSDEPPKIDVSTENVGNNILMHVADQGNGMSKQVQKRVFEKFYREHTGNVHNVKGHGLGLAYVKRIVEDHQGHISVESEKGKGSVFTIKLPLIS
ncbi:two-component system phosphate regulon sensor histidine kinase PhoR [Flavobacteriaceae bacterium MAR_2010_72]|nr:two-component system phosphate regulon sensor histidine kinase PhoR [Flavobacteriaceae bacterium MAR_2010_72]TVZ59437.1 two-component system phosphate regulon sensor histidine kinase PhoR [Flavobacteriaceae bacterium MAR_2010_105]